MGGRTGIRKPGTPMGIVPTCYCLVLMAGVSQLDTTLTCIPSLVSQVQACLSPAHLDSPALMPRMRVDDGASHLDPCSNTHGLPEVESSRRPFETSTSRCPTLDRIQSQRSGPSIGTVRELNPRDEPFPFSRVAIHIMIFTITFITCKITMHASEPSIALAATALYPEWSRCVGTEIKPIPKAMCQHCCM